jgi:hypothetical protein
MHFFLYNLNVCNLAIAKQTIDKNYRFFVNNYLQAIYIPFKHHLCQGFIADRLKNNHKDTKTQSKAVALSLRGACEEDNIICLCEVRRQPNEESSAKLINNLPLLGEG